MVCLKCHSYLFIYLWMRHKQTLNSFRTTETRKVVTDRASLHIAVVVVVVVGFNEMHSTCASCISCALFKVEVFLRNAEWEGGEVRGGGNEYG